MKTKYEVGQRFTLNQDFDTSLDDDLITNENATDSIAKKGSQISIYEIEEDGCSNCSESCSDCEINFIKVDFESVGNWVRLTEEEIDSIVVKRLKL